MHVRINVIANQCMEFGLIVFEWNDLEFAFESTIFSLLIHTIILHNGLSLTITSLLRPHVPFVVLFGFSCSGKLFCTFFLGALQMNVAYNTQTVS